MKRQRWPLGFLFFAIAVLLAIDLLDRPSNVTHVTLELGAAFLAAIAFLWWWVSEIRRAFT